MLTSFMCRLLRQAYVILSAETNILLTHYNKCNGSFSQEKYAYTVSFLPVGTLVICAVQDYLKTRVN